MSKPPRRALIVIDVQNEYVTGNLPIEYPDVQLSLANVGAAINAARAAGIPAAVLQAAEWIASLASGATPERDSISMSNRRARVSTPMAS